MNLLNSIGFFVLGVTMEVLPRLTPMFTPASSSFFSDASALWLEFMGAVVFLIGSGYTAKGLAAALPKPSARAGASAPVAARARERSSLAAESKQAII